MKKTNKRTNHNTTTPLEHGMGKNVDITRETIQGKREENEKAEMEKNSGENDEAENFNYINSYLTEIFELAKGDGSVSSKEDDKTKGTHEKSSELGETISRLHTKNNSSNIEWELDNTYEFETMESGGYPNGDAQLVEGVAAVEVTENMDEQNYNIFGSKSLFNQFGSFNKNGNPGVWLTEKEEIYNAPKGKGVQNGECMEMTEGRGDLLIDDVVRGSSPMERGENFHMLEEDAFHMGGSSEKQESDDVNVELLLAQLSGSNGHVDGIETVQTGNPQELNKNLFQLLSSSNREFLRDYIKKYREVGECDEEAVIRGEAVEETGVDGTVVEGHVQGQNAPRLDCYGKGKSVCFDLPSRENSIMLNGQDTQTYVKSGRGNEGGIGFKSERSKSSGDNVNRDNSVKQDLEEYKKEGYEHTDSNAPSLFFIPEWVRTYQGGTGMQGRGLDRGDTEGKRSTATPPNHVAPANEWDEKIPSVGTNFKEYTTSELYNNLLELLNDGSHNVKVDNMNHEVGMHSGEDLIRGGTAPYYHGDILKRMKHEGERDSHVGDHHRGGNHAFIRRANYEAVRNYANGTSRVDNGGKMSELERGVTMGNMSSTTLPVKSYLKYPTTPLSISHDNARGSSPNGGQSTHGSPNTVAKKKNVMFEALKNKIGFLLDNEDDEASLSEYIMDAIGDYNRSKWGRAASTRESMQVGRPSVGASAGLVYNRLAGEQQTGHVGQSTQNGILKSETMNYNYSRPTEHLSEADLHSQHGITADFLLGRAHTETYNGRYSQVDRIRRGSPPQGAELEAIREDNWRADNFNGGSPHVRNRTQRSNMANLKLFLANSLVANNISNSRGAQGAAVGAVGGAGLAVEPGIPGGNMSGYTVGQRTSLGGDSALGPRGDDLAASDGRNSENVGSFQWGDYSIERGDATRGHVRRANKEENNEEELRKIYEILFLLSRRNSRSLPFGDVSKVEQEGSAAQDASTNGYVLPPHEGNSLMRIPTNAHRDDVLAPKGGNSFLKRGSENLKMDRAFGASGGSDSLSGVVGSFEKGHFIDEVGSNWSSWNFKERERDTEEAKREDILFGGRRRDPSFSSRGKDAFEDSGNNSLWNRNLVSGSSATRGTYGAYALPRSNSSSSVRNNNGRRNRGRNNFRMDRPKSQEKRGMSNTRGKKKSTEARDQLSSQTLKACLSKEDEQDLERLLESLYDDRIIPLIINLKGRADEYNFRDVLKNNILNAYGLFPEKYTLKEHHPSTASSPPPADNCLVHFADRMVGKDYFFSINDSVDRYDSTLWDQFEKYLLEIASSDDPNLYSFTGGRYGMAKELQRRKLPFFQGLYLGHLCHIVHISATKKIIAYENNFIKPISQCRKYEDAKMGILNTRGGNAKNYIASMEELKFYLGAILKSHKRGINISTLKGKMMNNYNKRLCESVFHCVKLVELLQMEELRDVCVVDMDSRILRAVATR
ncbi:Uncharacterized protein PCOAH_00049340 [Plasmodium coatneyi]|uniref:HTH OST-type domain-containing protein n=1 Tax=Plasmodium coatneyi TaxID=208452 RepID=A0A1B1E6B0_9APIC|nr:Uncharacterized protein PCOAH_00049340 [Plasmodium coatneyi]ANQ10490.1 Uncharacterized protein PCOAH_00049340 [Plasmodium coatneyi]